MASDGSGTGLLSPRLLAVTAVVSALLTAWAVAYGLAKGAIE